MENDHLGAQLNQKSSKIINAVWDGVIIVILIPLILLMVYRLRNELKDNVVDKFKIMQYLTVLSVFVINLACLNTFLFFPGWNTYLVQKFDHFKFMSIFHFQISNQL